MSNKKKLIFGILLGILIGTTLSITYSFFVYQRTGNNQQLIAGNIYMNYKEKNEINLENAFPSSTYDENNYFEFTIEGTNTTTNKSIYYDVNLIRGDVPTGKLEANRLRDQDIKFTLTRQIGNGNIETLVNAKSYGDLSSALTMAVGEIQAGDSNVSHKFKLYAWISYDVVIYGGNPIDGGYEQSTWNNMFASFKVNVTGDFAEKEVARPINQVINTTTKDTGIKFYNVSSASNGQGLYMMESTENDTYPIYYYRGNVNNNNVYFAENCWKIVRTTSTGGLKLVYNGLADDVDGEKQCNQTTGTGTQLSAGMKAFNSSYNSPAYVGYSLPESSKRYSYSTQSLNSTTYYGSSVDPTTYKLVDPVLELNDTHHYSYNSTNPDATGISGDTGNVRYYYYQDGTTGYFVKFDKTKSVSTILNDMLSESNSKNNPSTIQGVINTWWGTGDNSLNSKYGEYLEDTEWCNDRSIGDLGGWNPDGGELNKYLYFTTIVRYDQSTFGSNANNIKNTNTPVLSCSRPVDRLTVANGNLTYPIGLLTFDEVAMAGARWSNANINFYLYTNQYYWLLSPSLFYSYPYVGDVYSSGFLVNALVYTTYGVRPALSLKLGTQILRGKGTKTKPYIITED